MGARPWRIAMQDALYGENGFFCRRDAPADHFRTSAHTGRAFGVAIMAILVAIDEALGRPDPLDVVDVGAGRGELLTALSELAPPGLATRLRPAAVEVAKRPDRLPGGVEWLDELPDRVDGLLIGTEWLDNVPVDVVARDLDGWRYVLVDEAGTQSLGATPGPDDTAWLNAWWPAGEQAEIGRPRDAAWSAAVARVARGLAIAIDYGHTRDTRPPLGTLAAYRDGVEVQPVPDGSCDLTAHVAMDAAGAAAGRRFWLVRQADALRALGVSGRRPPLGMARAEPGRYIRALADASVAAELTDETGLGGHYWLWQPIGVDLPPPTMKRW